MRQKVIFHMDGDSFFVGCEVAKNPKLKGLPVVTGEERGIVSAASYEAKALGVTRGYPIFKLRKDFPNVLVLPGDYQSYAKYSQDMFDIVRRYVDEVEEYSIDECFADLTGYDKPLYMTYEEIARRIKNEINNELGLSISVGVAPTKSLSKVASKWKKPDGFTIIEKDKIYDFLNKTPIEKIWGIGPRTSDFLRRRGVGSAGDFARRDINWVKENLSKPYEVIWLELNGVSVMEIDAEPKTEYSSIQKTRTFTPSTGDKEFLMSQLSKNIEEACRKARHYNLSPKKVYFFLKTQGFKYCGYSTEILFPTNAPEILVSLARKNFNKIWKAGIHYRTTGVVLFELGSNLVTQLNLFNSNEKENKFETIHEQIDNLEKKFGKRVLYLGSTEKAIKRKVKGTDHDDLDRDLLFL